MEHITDGSNLMPSVAAPECDVTSQHTIIHQVEEGVVQAIYYALGAKPGVGEKIRVLLGDDWLQILLDAMPATRVAAILDDESAIQYLIEKRFRLIRRGVVVDKRKKEKTRKGQQSEEKPESSSSEDTDLDQKILSSPGSESDFAIDSDCASTVVTSSNPDSHAKSVVPIETPTARTTLAIRRALRLIPNLDELLAALKANEATAQERFIIALQPLIFDRIPRRRIHEKTCLDPSDYVQVILMTLYRGADSFCTKISNLPKDEVLPFILKSIDYQFNTAFKTKENRLKKFQTLEAHSHFAEDDFIKRNEIYVKQRLFLMDLLVYIKDKAAKDPNGYGNRLKVLECILDGAESPDDIAHKTGLLRNTVYNSERLLRRDGAELLERQKRKE